MLANYLITAVVTSVVLIGIRAGADGNATAVVAYMVEISIRVVANIVLAAVVVTDVVKISICVTESRSENGAALKAGRRAFAGCGAFAVASYVRLAAYVAGVVAVHGSVKAKVKVGSAVVVADVVGVLVLVSESSTAYKGICVILADVAAGAGLVVNGRVYTVCRSFQRLGLYGLCGIGVGKSLTLRNRTGLTGLRSGAGCIRPVVTECRYGRRFYLSALGAFALK